MSDNHTAIAATASRPEELHRLLALRFNQGDLEGVVGLHDCAATLVPAPGQQVSAVESGAEVVLEPPRDRGDAPPTRR